MALKNLKILQPTIFLPASFDTYFKIEIIADDGTVYTVADSSSGDVDSNFLLSGSITRTATDNIDSFRLEMSNDGGRFLDKFDGGEIVKFYADATDASTIMFAGIIDNVYYNVNSSNGFFVEITGRAYPEIIDKTITGIEAGATADVSLAGILYEFYSNVTLMYWNGTSWSEAIYNAGGDNVTWSPVAPSFPTTVINMTYQHRKGWNVITEICGRANLDCYMEYDNTNARWLLRIFDQEAITNTGAGVAYGTNLLSLDDYGVDNNEIFNRNIVYGKTESDNIVLLKTENDTASQSNLWIKDRIFNASDLTTMDEVADKAAYELSVGIVAPKSGRIQSAGLYNLKPGDMIMCVVPYCGLNGLHKVNSFTHNFSSVFTTNIELSSKQKKIADIFIPKINSDEFLDFNSNINSMVDSYTIYFNESPSLMSHSNTEEVDGRLQLQTGETDGTATSDALTTDFDVTECELRTYENFAVTNDTYDVSNNNGVTWESYTAGNGETHTFSAPGNLLRVRLNLSRTAAGDTSPIYESICLLYK